MPYLYMRSPCPYFLQWTSAETARPESAEVIKADAEQDAKHKTHPMMTDCIETKSPVVEDESTNDALQEIVGKAHLAYALKA